MLEELRKMIDDLNSSNSNNDKIDTLKKYSNLEKVLYYTYSPFMQFYVTSKSLDKHTKINEQYKTDNQDDLFTLLDKLNKGTLSGHSGKEAINGYISSFPEYGDLVRMIIDGNLKIRMSAPSINKVFPGLIPKFDVALAKAYEDRLVDFDSHDFYVSRKLDGARCITIVKDGDVKCFSRTGKEFETLDLLKSSISQDILEKDVKYLPSKDFVLDGEICIVDENGDEDFSLIMKEIKKKNHTIKNPKYKIFDILSLSDFLAQKSTDILSTRIERYMQIDSPSGVLDPVAQEKVKSTERLNEIFEESVKKKWEGNILRKDVEYKGKRSNDLLKLKKFHDAEYVVKSTINGPFRIIEKSSGLEKEEVMLASVVIEHKGNKVNVGSGFSIAQRQEFFKDESLIVGKTIKVQYFEESEDKEGNESLRFPTLKFIYGEKRDV